MSEVALMAELNEISEHITTHSERFRAIMLKMTDALKAIHEGVMTTQYVAPETYASLAQGYNAVRNGIEELGEALQSIANDEKRRGAVLTELADEWRDLEAEIRSELAVARAR